MKGTPSQTLTATTEILAQVGSSSHGIAAMPPPSRILLRMPLSRLKRNRQAKTETKPGTAQGRMSAIR